MVRRVLSDNEEEEDSGARSGPLDDRSNKVYSVIGAGVRRLTASTEACSNQPRGTRSEARKCRQRA